MPIATRGAVKTLDSQDLHSLGADVILGNTYHLSLRPGEKLIARADGLHGFMRWPKPILTDSGGFQVWSLTKLRKVSEQGVTFRDDVEGKLHTLTPERSLAIQESLGSDISMVLDELVGYPSTGAVVQSAMARTTRWAARSRKAFHKRKGHMVFGIVQGGVFPDLRKQHAKELVSVGFDGYAIGGLSVGEPVKDMYRVLDVTVPNLPKENPRYLMGVGPPDQIVEAVRRGVDMFDCVIPTRNARHGLLYIWKGSMTRSIFSKDFTFFDELRIKQERFKKDLKVLDPKCDCPTCSAGYSRAYLRHLIQTGDPAALRLATMHNVRFYLRLMERIRSR